ALNVDAAALVGHSMGTRPPRFTCLRGAAARPCQPDRPPRTRPGCAACRPPCTGVAAPERAPLDLGRRPPGQSGVYADGVTVVVFAGHSSFPALGDSDQVKISDSPKVD